MKRKLAKERFVAHEGQIIGFSQCINCINFNSVDFKCQIFSEKLANMYLGNAKKCEKRMKI